MIIHGARGIALLAGVSVALASAPADPVLYVTHLISETKMGP